MCCFCIEKKGGLPYFKFTTFNCELCFETVQKKTKQTMQVSSFDVWRAGALATELLQQSSLQGSFLPTSCYRIQNTSVEAVAVQKGITASVSLNLEVHITVLPIRTASRVPVPAPLHASVSLNKDLHNPPSTKITDIQSVNTKLY